MSDAAKLDAVRQLLQNAFPKGTIQEDVDPDEIGRRFTVTCQGARYITVISREFLDSHDGHCDQRGPEPLIFERNI